MGGKLGKDLKYAWIKKLDVVFQRNFAQADNYMTEIIPKANVF